MHRVHGSGEPFFLSLRLFAHLSPLNLVGLMRIYVCACMYVCVCRPGPTNKKLRVHLPVLAPARGLSRLRVGSETREAVAGKALVFDDSFEHEAWNDSSGTGDRNGSGNGNGTENDADNSTGSLSLSSEGDSEPLRKGRPGETGQDRHGVSSPGEAMGTGDTKSTQAESGAAPRVTLIADVWHPDLSNRWVTFLSLQPNGITLR